MASGVRIEVDDGPVIQLDRGFDSEVLLEVLDLVAPCGTPDPRSALFVGLDPVDMRGSFGALAGHVRRRHRDPLDGHLYLFVDRRCRLSSTRTVGSL